MSQSSTLETDQSASQRKPSRCDCPKPRSVRSINLLLCCQFCSSTSAKQRAMTEVATKTEGPATRIRNTRSRPGKRRLFGNSRPSAASLQAAAAKPRRSRPTRQKELTVCDATAISRAPYSVSQLTGFSRDAAITTCGTMQANATSATARAAQRTRRGGRAKPNNAHADAQAKPC